MLISFYIGMMLLQIENRWWFVLKLSEPQVYLLKESNIEELKDVIRQKVAEIPPNTTFGLFVNL